MTPQEQARFRAELRRARRGHWLALHILLLLALHHSPSEIATFLLCARSTVYAVARDWQRGRSWPEPTKAGWPPSLTPSLQRSLLALLRKAPTAYGWCRTRWSCAALALQLELQHGIRVSAETVRRCLHALDWVWKRAKLIAKDSAPERASKRARIRGVSEQLDRRGGLLFSDQLDLHFLTKIGGQWEPPAAQMEGKTPRQKESRDRGGELELHTGQGGH